MIKISVLKGKFKSITFKYGIIFLITGLLIAIYTAIIFNHVTDANLGIRFKLDDFYESDLFKFIAIFQIIIGIIYLIIEFRASFLLNDKKTWKSFWFTNSFILLILMIPILDKYYPTDKYGDTILSQIIMIYIFVSLILFLGGIYLFYANLISSIYSYFVIKKSWKN